MEGIGGNHGALQRRLGQFVEQRFERRDFIALLRDGFLGHGQPEAVADGREQLQRFAIAATAAAQAFAIDGQGLENGDFLGRSSRK